MGYDYQRRRRSPVGSVAPHRRPGYDIARHRRAPTSAGCPPRRSSSACRTTAGPGRPHSRRSTRKNISGTKYGAVDDGRLQHRAASSPPTTAGATTRSRASPGPPTGARTAPTTYGCVNPWRQLYYDDATALGAKYDLVNRYGLRGAGIWALGYDGTRPELYALKAKFITDTVPPAISAASRQRAGRLAERRRPAGQHDRPRSTVDRPRPLRLARPAVVDGIAGTEPCAAGPSPARPWPSPGTARTRRGRGRRRRHLPGHALDRGRLGQPGRSVRKVVTVDRRARRVDARRRSRASSRPMATASPTRTTLSLDAPTKPSPATARPATSRRDGPRSGRSRAATPGRGPGTAATHGRVDGRRRALHAPGQRPATGPATRRPRPARPRRPDDPLGRLGDGLVRPPRAGAARTGSTSAAPQATVTVRDLPGQRPWSADLDRAGPWRRAPTAGPGTAGRPPAPFVEPGTYRVVVDATSWLGASRSTRNVVVEAP